MREREGGNKSLFWLLVGLCLTMIGVVIGWGLNHQTEDNDSVDPQKPPSNAQSALPDAKVQSQNNSVPTPKRELNWDVIGLASVAITLMSAGVFYIAGWVYEARWYSFYGLEVSQFQLDPARVMVQGMPGILLLTASITLSLILFSTGKAYTQIVQSDNTIREEDAIQVSGLNILTVGVSAYFNALIFVFGFSLYVTFVEKGEIPLEALVSIVPGFIMFTIFFLASVINQPVLADLMDDYPTFSHPIHSSWLTIFFIYLYQIGTWLIAFRDYLGRVSTWLTAFVAHFVVNVLWFRHLYFGSVDAAISEATEQRYVNVIDDIWNVRTRRFLLSLVFLLVFLISISTSSLLGEFDARRGSRTLSGNWSLPMVFVFSEKPVSVLNRLKQETKGLGFVYGPLGLISRNETMLFLTDWKQADYFEDQPTLYLVPHKSEQSFSISYPTPTPTLVPTPTSTATPLPTATATPLSAEPDSSR